MLLESLIKFKIDDFKQHNINSSSSSAIHFNSTAIGADNPENFISGLENGENKTQSTTYAFYSCSTKYSS